MNALRACALSLVLAQLALGSQAFALEAEHEQAASPIHVQTFANQPVEITYHLQDAASALPWLPESLEVRNTSIYGIPFAAIDIVLPDVPDGDEVFRMQVGWGKNIVGAANYVTRDALQPGEVVVLPIPSHYRTELAERLTKRHLHISDIHEVIIAVSGIALDNGYNYVPAGYIRVV